MEASMRAEDMNAEKELGKFMDLYFYDKLPGENGESVTHIRKMDRESQLKGVDIELSIGGKKLRIDEKAAIHYCNVMLPTFAFEINFIPERYEAPVDGSLMMNSPQTIIC